jgi:uncharacterized protein
MTGVLDLLVSAGARIDSLEMAAAAGDVSSWPLERADPETRIRALVFAADHQRLDVIDQLIAARIPINQADAEWHRLPLHVAAQNGRPASIRRLLAHGADPNLRDTGHRRTPLEWCQPPNRYLDNPAHDEAEAILQPLTRRSRSAHGSSAC